MALHFPVVEDEVGLRGMMIFHGCRIGRQRGIWKSQKDVDRNTEFLSRDLPGPGYEVEGREFSGNRLFRVFEVLLSKTITGHELVQLTGGDACLFRGLFDPPLISLEDLF